MSTRNWLPTISTVFIGLLSMTSCDQDSRTFLDPIHNVGALEGFVLVAGEPRVVTVGARELTGGGRVIAKTQSRRDGWYRLELPVDSYRIEINPGNFGFRSPDTTHVVHVEPRNKRLNLIRSRLTVRMRTPSEMEGLRLECFLRSSDPYLRGLSEPGRVENSTIEFTFDLLEPGTYRVAIRGFGGTWYWLPGTYEEKEAQLIVVRPERETRHDGAFVRHASITGSVRGSWQQVSGRAPDIRAFSSDSVLVSRAQPQSDGTFRLHLALTEPVKIRVGGFLEVEQWIGGSFSKATVYHPQPGETITGVEWVGSGIELRLEGPGSFTGHLAQVLLRDATGKEFEFARNFGNPFTITNLSPGRYFLYVSGRCAYRPQPWKSQWFAGANSYETATAIDLGPGQLVPIIMNLESGGAIKGRVFLEPGQFGTRVGVFDQNGDPLCENANWFDRGFFSFEGLNDGDYFVAAISGNNRWWYPGTSSLGSAQVISVRDAGTVSGIEWHLEPQ